MKSVDAKAIEKNGARSVFLKRERGEVLISGGGEKVLIKKWSLPDGDGASREEKKTGRGSPQRQTRLGMLTEGRLRHLLAIPPEEGKKKKKRSRPERTSAIEVKQKRKSTPRSSDKKRDGKEIPRFPMEVQ